MQSGIFKYYLVGNHAYCEKQKIGYGLMRNGTLDVSIWKGEK